MDGNKLSNPAPLGLMGFGMTTVLLNLHNIGLYPLGSMILAMGVFYGGLAQIMAGVMEFRRGNTFATTAFTSYGLFWLSLVFLLILPDLGITAMADRSAMASYLFFWGFFTAWMSISTFQMNRGLQVVFITLAILFFLLSLGQYYPPLVGAAGVEGVLCGISAIYVAMAEVLNEVHSRPVLPLGEAGK